MAIEWKKEYELGFATIDAQHRQFVDTLNLIYTALIERKTAGTILSIFDELSTYIISHFKLEEKYFREFGYEKTEEHMQTHHEFRMKINSFHSRLVTEDERQVAFELLAYLGEWLFAHIKNEDGKYVECFRNHGLN